jgi:prephenate dehydrogenase
MSISTSANVHCSADMGKGLEILKITDGSLTSVPDVISNLADLVVFALPNHTIESVSDEYDRTNLA